MSKIKINKIERKKSHHCHQIYIQLAILCKTTKRKGLSKLNNNKLVSLYDVVPLLKAKRIKRKEKKLDCD